MKQADKQTDKQTDADRPSADPWALAEADPSGPRWTAEAVAAWREQAAAVRRHALSRGYGKGEMARQLGIAGSTFSEWFSGDWRGDVEAITARVGRGLAMLADNAERLALAMPDPGFVVTPTARELMNDLAYAQAMPEMVIAVLGSGMGKTITARAFVDGRPHAYLVTMRPTTGSVHGMLCELARALQVNERNSARLDSAIGDKLKRNGRHTLLVLDEAQNLNDAAVNQLRYLLDEYGCGIGLLGNEELYGRFGGDRATPAYAQIRRRIGKRLRRLQPQADDVAVLLDAYKIADGEMRALLSVIGQKAGALGEVAKTIKLASMLAAGAKRGLSVEDLQAAYQNRHGEPVRRGT
jgi:DNA transposition AAA+ family ATPase